MSNEKRENRKNMLKLRMKREKKEDAFNN